MLGTHSVDYLDIYQSPGWQRQKQLWDYADLGNEPIKWSATTTSTSLEMITNNIFSCFARLSHAWSWLSFSLICWRSAAVWSTLYLVPAFLPANYPAPPDTTLVAPSQHFPTLNTDYSVISLSTLSAPQNLAVLLLFIYINILAGNHNNSIGAVQSGKLSHFLVKRGGVRS